MLFLIYMTILIISFLAGLSIYFRKDLPAYLKLFPPFLLLTIIIELISRGLALRDMNNLILYNFFTTFEFIFYFFILQHVIQNKRTKKIILHIYWLYPTIALLNIFLIQGINVFHSFSFILGCLLVIVFCARHFYELISIPGSKNLSRVPTFWVCCGLFLFYTSSLPFYVAIKFMYFFSYTDIKIMWYALSIANYLLYFLFAIAFLCTIRIRKSRSLAVG